MKPLYISEPCTENWGAMSSTQKGAFCSSCSKEVIDFSHKSSDEIALILKQNMGSSLCGRFQVSQIDTFNQQVSDWHLSRAAHMRAASLFALIAVFGLTLFSCQSKEAAQAVFNVQRTLLESHMDIPQRDEQVAQEDRAQPTQSAQLLPYTHTSLLMNPELFKMYEYKEIDSLIYAQETIDYLMGAVHYTVEAERYLELIPTPDETRYANGELLPLAYEDLVYPNPTNGEAKYTLALPHDGVFVIGLYDMNGRHVRNIHEGELKAGRHAFDINLVDEQVGTYLIVCRSRNFSNTQRLVRV